MADRVLEVRLYRPWLPNTELEITSFASVSRDLLNPVIFLACSLLPSPDLSISLSSGRYGH